MTRLAPYALIACCAFLAYGAVLWNGAGFSHPDDVAVVGYPCCSFRPLAAISYTLNFRFGGWMATNLALHVIAASLLYRVSGSLIAALLFSAHPLAADTVASVAARSMLLASIGAFSFLAWRRIRILAIAGVILALGMTPVLMVVPNSPSFFSHIAGFIGAIGEYAIPKMVSPIGLSADPQINAGIVGIMAAISLAAFAYFRELRAPIALFFAGLVPYALVPLPDVLLEHRLYLSLAAGCWMLAMLPRPMVLVAIPVFLLLSQQRADVYRSPIALWTDAAEKSPSVARAQINAGIAHIWANRYPDAEEYLRRGIGIDSGIPRGHQGLAAVFLHRGDMAAASRQLDQIRKD